MNYRIEVEGVAHRIDRDDGGIVHAPAPSVVVSIAVKPGDMVSLGDRLVVLEAMKMEMEVVAPFEGRVRCILTIPNVQVDTGAPLLQIDPSSNEEGAASVDRVLFGASGPPAGNDDDVLSRCRRNLRELRQLMLGFDIDPAQTTRLLSQWSQDCPADSEEIWQDEDEILNIFVDICSLFHRQPRMDDPAGGEAPSAETYLFTYLRMLETQGQGLPPDYVDALRRAIAHYGITTLDRSPELEQALLWIYKSHQRVEQQVGPILVVLERRLQRVEVLLNHADQPFRGAAGGGVASDAGIRLGDLQLDEVRQLQARHPRDAVVQVPLFLNEGDVVKVDTRSGEYLGRVSAARASVASRRSARGPADPAGLSVEQVVELAVRHNLAEIEVEADGTGSHRAGARARRGRRASRPLPRSPLRLQPAATRGNPWRICSRIRLIVGTFYRAPSPDAPAFVEVGSR